jgi:hypothetical protein
VFSWLPKNKWLSEKNISSVPLIRILMENDKNKNME